jgi:hypothetical protein
MDARDFRLVDGDHLSNSRGALIARLDEWRAGWGLALAIDARAQAAHEGRHAGPLLPWWRTSSGDAWIAMDEDLSPALARELFPSDRGVALSSPLAGAVLMDARKDLLAAIGRALDTRGEFVPAQEEVPRDWFRRGSGAALFDLTIGGHPLQVLRSCAPKQPPAQDRTAATPCAAMHDALHDRPVDLVVTVGTLRLDLQSLASITTGDVLRLSTRLDEPSRVVTLDGTPVCSGYLGARGARRALSLSRLAAKETGA